MSQEKQNNRVQSNNQKIHKKRQYKGVTSSPVITGLADRSPSYTIKNGFQYKNKNK